MHEMNLIDRYAVEGMTVSLGTVHAWVKKYYTEAKIIRVQTRNRFPGFMPANLRWNVDGTGKVDAAARQYFILGMIDYDLLTYRRNST